MAQVVKRRLVLIIKGRPFHPKSPRGSLLLRLDTKPIDRNLHVFHPANIQLP